MLLSELNGGKLELGIKLDWTEDNSVDDNDVANAEGPSKLAGTAELELSNGLLKLNNEVAQEVRLFIEDVNALAERKVGAPADRSKDPSDDNKAKLGLTNKEASKPAESCPPVNRNIIKDNPAKADE
jgi:hypothetical protein